MQPQGQKIKLPFINIFRVIAGRELRRGLKVGQGGGRRGWELECYGRFVIPNNSLDDIPVAQPISLNMRVTQSLLQFLHHVLRAKVWHLRQQARDSFHRPVGNSGAPSNFDVGA